MLNYKINSMKAFDFWTICVAPLVLRGYLLQGIGNDP